MPVECNIQYELTDTFGGEANYSWVKRGKIPKGNKAFSNLAAVRAVKKEIGWNGLRSKTYEYGDYITIIPQGICQICYIDFHFFGSAS